MSQRATVNPRKMSGFGTERRLQATGTRQLMVRFRTSSRFNDDKSMAKDQYKLKMSVIISSPPTAKNRCSLIARQSSKAHSTTTKGRQCGQSPHHRKLVVVSRHTQKMWGSVCLYALPTNTSRPIPSQDRGWLRTTLRSFPQAHTGARDPSLGPG